MENCVYVMFNKLSKRYESVMSFASDEMCIHRLKNNVDLEEYDICRIGKINIDTGILTSEAPVRLVITGVDKMCKEVN